MTLIPPLQITISGNKCGGCCRSTRVRGDEAPPHYVVYHIGGINKLIAAPYAKMEASREREVARTIYEVVKLHLTTVYNVNFDDLPLCAKPMDLTKAPSVATIKTLEAAASAFCEGVKRGQSSVASVATPKIARSSSGEGSD